MTAAHDRRCAELARYKLGRITADDADGFHRTMCPASMSKLRCPLRTDSMTLAHDRPEVLSPPEHPPTCCTQQTITVGPAVNAEDGPEARLPLAGAPRRATTGAPRPNARTRQSRTRRRPTSPGAGAGSWASRP